MTKLEILEEIQRLRRALGLEQRVIKVPAGSGRTEHGTRGRCVVCDKEYEAADTIRRCCRDTMIVIKGEKKRITIGYRVCYHCSPYTQDWQLERYAENVHSWPEHWKGFKDTGVYGSKSVDPTRGSRLDELNQYYEDEDMAYLDTQIKLIEAKLHDKT